MAMNAPETPFSPQVFCTISFGDQSCFPGCPNNSPNTLPAGFGATEGPGIAAAAELTGAVGTNAGGGAGAGISGSGCLGGGGAAQGTLGAGILGPGSGLGGDAIGVAAGPGAVGNGILGAGIF